MPWKVHDFPAKYQVQIKPQLAQAHNLQAGVGEVDLTPGGSKVVEPEAGATPSRARRQLEKDLHEQVADYCREKGWYFIHSRMDRRSTVAIGTPDFAIAIPNGRMIWLELKRPGGKATPKQLATIEHLKKLGHIARIVDCWASAFTWLDMWNEQA